MKSDKPNPLSPEAHIAQLGENARAVQADIGGADTAVKNAALCAVAKHLRAHQKQICAANQKDMREGQRRQLSDALLDRLLLDETRIDAMANGCLEIAALPDPIGEISAMTRRPSGIEVGQMRAPLGTIGIIYESRPNVTIDAAALCVKAGNAVVLRGGSEAFHSNLALGESLRAGLTEARLPGNVVQLVETTERGAVGAMIQLPQYFDVIVPRGGASLIERITAEARVPVIKHAAGVCHVYIDAYADLDKAIAVAYNAKTRRHGICGAMETLLINRDIADAVLPKLAQQYRDAGIELRGCEQSRALVATMREAREDDWRSEYLDAILAVRIVNHIDDAIAHINTFGSHHTDAIVTENISHARRFLREVDSSSVMVNASTQFADGFEYGLGAEIGISTDKLHARGPVGLYGLTCQKYIVIGDGHVRA